MKYVGIRVGWVRQVTEDVQDFHGAVAEMLQLMSSKDKGAAVGRGRRAVQEGATSL